MTENPNSLLPDSSVVAENISFIAFSGRIGRKNFVLRWLPLSLFSLFFEIQSYIHQINGSLTTGLLISLYLIIIPLTVISIGFKLRRLRDIGLSKWLVFLLVFLTLIPPLSPFLALYMLLSPGKKTI